MAPTLSHGRLAHQPQVTKGEDSVTSGSSWGPTEPATVLPGGHSDPARVRSGPNVNVSRLLENLAGRNTVASYTALASHAFLD